MLEAENNPQFPKDSRKLGINTVLASYMSKDEVQKLKIDYYEIGAIKTADRMPQDKVNELKLVPNLYYKSQKLVSAGNKVYSSRAAFLAGKEKPATNEFEPVIDCEIFWDNANDFYFVQKNDWQSDSLRLTWVMILIDLLQKYLHSSKFTNTGDISFSHKEAKETRELIALLTLKNIWTVEDLKKALK